MVNTAGVNRLDPRTRSLGWARILIFSVAAITIWIGGVEVVEFVRTAHSSVRLTAVLATLGYVAGALGLIHNGRKMRLISWVAYVGELVALLCVLALTRPTSPEVALAWAKAGAYFYYLPAFLPLVAIIWLAWSDPRRLVGR
ncbi:MAG: hypothetical protein E6700_04620 [Winkia neuii]|uniref:Uncharacterized protein n=1 Tax=Winkia neuii TaxID=33007 RepID=A0A2I1IKY9_9ACTO|nr:hypothetical protein [Winkia neuii]OFJ71276.1 hypothetical protein HMPREF2851_08175 [Actinomyces sp. HMSC064C12]OFK03841.1 hypothetical protein HMPREF2835_04780 [Actinomyces sp. HMSC072A03]OFT56047.1 hypothetical protein HMPREF3152_02875 [Actinomyces sp. HMSC06A08]MDU3134844.1 hypothetical protein [Winkia neuii]PKY71772.1 hypothetical protein CYJ19_08595 [Winkia neuii]